MERRAVAAADAAHALDERITTINQHVSQELATLEYGTNEATARLVDRLDDLDSRLTPSRRFTASKHPESRLVELTMRDATDSLSRRVPDSAT